MKSRYSDKPEVEWKMGDVRAMIDFDAKSVDVAFNKGTLDAMIYGDPWSPPEEVMNNSGKYISEVCKDADSSHILICCYASSLSHMLTEVGLENIEG